LYESLHWKLKFPAAEREREGKEGYQSLFTKDIMSTTHAGTSLESLCPLPVWPGRVWRTQTDKGNS